MFNQQKLSDLLAGIIKSGVFFVLFLPLVMNSSFFFPFIVPKNLLFRVATEILFFLYLILWQVNPAYRLKLTKIFWAVLAYTAAMVLAGALGLGWYSSFWGNYERMAGIFHQLHLLLYFIVLAAVIKNRKDWQSLFTVSIFYSILMCFIALAQFWNLPFLLRSSGGTRLTGTIGNPIYLAVYLLFNLYFVLYFFFSNKAFNLKLLATCFIALDFLLVVGGIFGQLFSLFQWGMWEFIKAPLLKSAFDYPKYVVLFLLFQAAVFTAWYFRKNKAAVWSLLSLIFAFQFFIFWKTQTRGALLGFIGGILALLLVNLFLPIDKKIKQVSGGLIVGLILLALGAFLAKDLPIVKNSYTLSRLVTISTSDITTESRLLTWQTSWQGWTENPKRFLIGYGPEHYYYVFNKRFPVPIYRDSGSQIWFDRAHNFIFDIGVSTGLIGLLAFLAMVFFSAWSFFKNYLKEKNYQQSWLFISLLAAYLFQNLFVFDNMNTEILLYLVFGFAAYLMVAKPEVEGEEEAKALPPVSLRYLTTAVFAVLLFFGLTLNLQTARANNYLVKSLSIGGSGNQPATAKFDFFRRAINEAVTGHLEARQQLASFAIQTAKDTSVQPSLIMSIINFTTSELEKNVSTEPFNIRQHLFMAMYYNGIYDIDKNAPQKAAKLLEESVKLSPDRPQVYFELAQSYALMGNYDQAEKYFKKGVDVSPKVIDSHWGLLTLYAISGQDDKAKKEWQLMLDLGLPKNRDNYLRLVELYSRVNKPERIFELINELISFDDTAENYAFLASAYAKYNQYQPAIDAANEAIKRNPKFAKEAGAFIEQMKAAMSAPKK